MAKVSRERYKYEAGANNMSTVENPQQEFSLLEKGKKGKKEVLHIFFPYKMLNKSPS